MKVDPSKSQYHEARTASDEFNSAEIRRCRLLLRRLRFLEAKIREQGGLADGSGSGGSAFAEWEADALAWALDDLGYLQPRTKTGAKK